ncbi:helix-turn-helix domain-containing protein [Oceanobacillus sp. 1P07AA]|uniref:helix-turn-helix domain-containing protein n=1 Tax=Oceanobacillus sp. 1P07AA TaxID=3132293 RepID=UPI0039A70A75
MVDQERVVLIDSLVEDFGRAVRDFRIRSGITLQDMAFIISCSPSYIWRIEAHRRNPEVDFRIRVLNQAMGFSAEDICLYLEKYMEKNKSASEV